MVKWLISLIFKKLTLKAADGIKGISEAIRSQQMTENQIIRVRRALAETHTALDRAMRYAPDLRDHELIAFYETHIIKLTQMLTHSGER
jgi:hypothetical protein